MNNLLGSGSNLERRVINDYSKLRDIIGACRLLGKNIVLTSGSWDLIHVGHGRYMEKAKQSITGVNQEEVVLVVGVDSDEKIRKKKGANRPVVSQDERVEMLCHIRHVDIVTLKNIDDEKWKLIKTVQPDVLIVSKRTDYDEKQIKDLAQYVGKVVVLESQATTSTTARIRMLIIDVASKFGMKFDEFKQKILETVNNMDDNMKNFLEELTGGGHE